MMLKEIGVGVAGAVLASAVMGAFVMHSDVQVTKVRMEGIQKAMEERQIATKQYTDMIQHMDKAIVVQAQSVKALEDAVIRLEKFVMLAYKNEQLKNMELDD
ncbi:MAG: hypothetical protein ACRCZ2_13125 [Fusobacteriaceae bacterium]